MYLRVFISLLLMSAPIYRSNAADISPEDKKSLQDIQDKVEISTEKLARIDKQIKIEKSEVGRLDSALLDIKSKEKIELSELESFSDKAELVKTKIVEIDNRFSQIEEYSLKRLRVAYMQPSYDTLTAFFHPNKTVMGADRISYFLSKIRGADFREFARLRKIQVEKESQQRKLKSLLDSQEEKISSIHSMRQRKEVERKKRVQAVSNLKKSQMKQEALILTFQAEALRLEAVLASLTNDTTLVTEVGEEQREERRRVVIPVQSFRGKGLPSKKGVTKLPVTGVVLKDYGKRKQTSFKDIVLQKGIEFKTLDSQKVRAMYSGKVLFKGEMPVYGNIVIIDHGDRYYSLYGRVDDIEVSVGDKVEIGEEIAIVEQDIFYFEVRKDRQAIDPQSYFTKKFLVGRSVS